MERIKDQRQDRSRTQDATPPADPPKNRTKMVGIALIAAVVIAGCIGWFLSSGTYESTDDAQVDAHLNPIAARVQGTVTTVYVEYSRLAASR